MPPLDVPPQDMPPQSNSRKLIIGLLIGATLLLVVIVIMGFFSGNAYATAYDNISMPADLSSATCKFGAVAGSSKQQLKCATTFKSTVNVEMTALTKSFDDAGWVVDRNSIQDDGTGVVWAQNGTWLIEITMTGQKTSDGFVGHYQAQMERGADFGQFN